MIRGSGNVVFLSPAHRSDFNKVLEKYGIPLLLDHFIIHDTNDLLLRALIFFISGELRWFFQKQNMIMSSIDCALLCILLKVLILLSDQVVYRMRVYC